MGMSAEQQRGAQGSQELVGDAAAAIRGSSPMDASFSSQGGPSSVVRGGAISPEGVEDLRWVPYTVSACGMSATGSYRPPEPPSQDVSYGVGRDASPIPPEGYRPTATIPSPDPCTRYAAPGEVYPQQPSIPPVPPAFPTPAAPPAPMGSGGSSAPVSSADRNVAAVLAILFGAFGVHKFYLRYYLPACLMLGITLLGGFVGLPLMSWAVWVVAIIEGVLYLSKSQAQFYQTYVAGRREWF